MLLINNKKIKKHYDALVNDVFFVNTKWPQFDILFKDIVRLSKKFRNKKVLSLERGGLYGNISIFAPFFYKANFYSIDCSEKNIKKRGAYNRKLIINKDIIKIPINKHINYKNINLDKCSVDLIIIPNLMHHIYDHKFLIKNCHKALKKNGQIYVFEPTLRELHQKPCDYFRFTPYGLEELLKENKFKKIKTSYSGGPFTAAAYCWDQAMQYLPNKKKNEYKKFFISDEIKTIKNLDIKFKKNLVRRNTTFPTSFSILSKKK